MKITFPDKIQYENNPLDPVYKLTAADVNHIKSVVNTNADGDFIQGNVATNGPSITLDIASKERAYLSGASAYGSPKQILIIGDERATELTYMFELSDVAAVMTFDSATTRSSDARFLNGVFTPQDVGLYKAEGRKYGNLWLLDFRSVYSVGDAPPNPPDPPTGVFVFYDDDSNVFYDDNVTKVEYEQV